MTSKLIYDNLRQGMPKALISKNEVIEYVRSHEFDVLVVLGAGDLDNYADEITQILKTRCK